MSVSNCMQNTSEACDKILVKPLIRPVQPTAGKNFLHIFAHLDIFICTLRHLGISLLAETLVLSWFHRKQVYEKSFFKLDHENKVT